MRHTMRSRDEFCAADLALVDALDENARASASDTHPTISLIELVDAEETPSGGVAVPIEGLYYENEVRAAMEDIAYAFETDAGDLEGPADPNQVIRDSDGSLRICALGDTLS